MHLCNACNVQWFLLARKPMEQNEWVINKRLKYLLVNDMVEKYTIVVSLACCAQTKKYLNTFGHRIYGIFRNFFSAVKATQTSSWVNYAYWIYSRQFAFNASVYTGQMVCWFRKWNGCVWVTGRGTLENRCFQHWENGRNLMNSDARKKWRTDVILS